MVNDSWSDINIKIPQRKISNFIRIISEVKESQVKDFQERMEKLPEKLNEAVGWKIPLYTKEEMRRKLKSIKNEKVLHSLLEEILPYFGFSDIEVTHGANENGVDLIASSINPFNIKEWNYFICKTGKIDHPSSETITGTLKELQSQKNQSLTIPRQKLNESKIIPTRIFIVTNDTITSNAQNLLTYTDKPCQVFCIWNSKIIEFCEN